VGSISRSSSSTSIWCSSTSRRSVSTGGPRRRRGDSGRRLPIRISQTISDQATSCGSATRRRRSAGESRGATAQVAGGVGESREDDAGCSARDGSWRGEARYRSIPVRAKFLALAMPLQSQILSLFVDGRPSRPIDPKLEGQADVVLVPLPKTAAGDLPVEVKLVYAGRFGRPLPKGVQVLRSELISPRRRWSRRAILECRWRPPSGRSVLPPDIDARPIDDSNRTNVAESGAGGEDLIAWYNEMQNLYVIVLDDSQSMRAQSRAKDNLKQIGLALHNSHEVESRLKPAIICASRAASRSEDKVQQAEKQWQARRLRNR